MFQLPTFFPRIVAVIGPHDDRNASLLLGCSLLVKRAVEIREVEATVYLRSMVKHETPEISTLELPPHAGFMQWEVAQGTDLCRIRHLVFVTGREDVCAGCAKEEL